MTEKQKKTKKIRDNAAGYISFPLMFVGTLIGAWNDWTLYVLLIPFGWIVLGSFLDGIINGNGGSGYNAVFCGFILANIIILFVHQDLWFVAGRLICVLGACIMIMRNTVNMIEEEQEKYDRLLEEKSRLYDEVWDLRLNRK